MRATVLILILALGSGIARAEDLAATTGTGAASGIMVNSSISLNLPLLAADPAARQAEEEGHRRDLYQRAIRECAVLLDSIASSCTITSVSVSTQVNSNPGQADYLYATANIAMQVALK
ncbi:hypothetical protein [Tabrizicola sp.]|uniref:hypothetical protein n=1 Tax=Tabrizicola sp. TaxID=2005166 RepID=UPI0035AFC06A